MKNKHLSPRVLHVIYNLEHGGIQSWLINLLRFSKSTDFRMEFLLLQPGPWPFDKDLELSNTPQYLLRWGHNPILFIIRLIAFLKKQGPFDVIHAHTYNQSAFVLVAAWFANVPIRLSHSHNTTALFQRGSLRGLYNRLCSIVINTFATRTLAVSTDSGKALFGQIAPEDLFPCGIDFTPYLAPVDRHLLRKNFKISLDCKVVGHVGRFNSAKNHMFILDIFKELLTLEPNAHLILVGNGDLMSKIQSRAQELGITSQVTFAGRRQDIPALMVGVFDLLLLPSHYEGYPIVAIEAQAAGLPVVMSENVPVDVCLNGQNIKRISLNNPAKLWANEILNTLGNHLSHSRTMLPKEISLDNNIKRLAAIYRSE
jgi:glycosyltransferase involved in cell wall biosynthesis